MAAIKQRLTESEPYSPEREPRVKSAGSRIEAVAKVRPRCGAARKGLIGWKAPLPGEGRVAYTGTRLEAG